MGQEVRRRAAREERSREKMMTMAMAASARETVILTLLSRLLFFSSFSSPSQHRWCNWLTAEVRPSHAPNLLPFYLPGFFTSAALDLCLKEAKPEVWLVTSWYTCMHAFGTCKSQRVHGKSLRYGNSMHAKAGEKKRRGNEKGEKKEKKEEDARGKKVDWPAVEARTRETRCIKVQKPCFHLLHRRYKHKGAK
ncbi:hypothetical protein MGYG_01251 [Nannizzia gypsea CBS 118893]|uniref:Uncharacterized protein n=1 Tax=Arthroderma gypseum (strain ATCC MYA-4604 / CBS 118893) TaxID=535722 RepID=E5QZR5_ARTGP|nr:hypothetical protein MGYG_01251 [Nannizzia gypsea CBS 118893]EFQ98216.1 hypothetical protein MGYG_01251 [Nannizzia gypsea CBS 118893]